MSARKSLPVRAGERLFRWGRRPSSEYFRRLFTQLSSVRGRCLLVKSFSLVVRRGGRSGAETVSFPWLSSHFATSIIALGDDGLKKIRAKGIGLHSSAIGDFCEWAGAYHLRTRLIKLAKTNGDILGFLV